MGRKISSQTPPNYGWGQEGCRYNGIQRFNTKVNLFQNGFISNWFQRKELKIFFKNALDLSPSLWKVPIYELSHFDRRSFNFFVMDQIFTKRKNYQLMMLLVEWFENVSWDKFGGSDYGLKRMRNLLIYSFFSDTITYTIYCWNRFVLM